VPAWCVVPSLTVMSAWMSSAVTGEMSCERPNRDYSASSAGAPAARAAGNWSSWNVTISVIAASVTRRTSIVRGALVAENALRLAVRQRGQRHSDNQIHLCPGDAGPRACISTDISALPLGHRSC
jgi:hypothetical protein